MGVLWVLFWEFLGTCSLVYSRVTHYRQTYQACALLRKKLNSWTPEDSFENQNPAECFLVKLMSLPIKKEIKEFTSDEDSVSSCHKALE